MTTQKRFVLILNRNTGDNTWLRVTDGVTEVMTANIDNAKQVDVAFRMAMLHKLARLIIAGDKGRTNEAMEKINEIFNAANDKGLFGEEKD
jgi:CO dehydrogenase/acetyl-CoA synthase beta subunit